MLLDLFKSVCVYENYDVCEDVTEMYEGLIFFLQLDKNTDEKRV